MPRARLQKEYLVDTPFQLLIIGKGNWKPGNQKRSEGTPISCWRVSGKMCLDELQWIEIKCQEEEE
jgi:hypothetical protein